MSLASRLESIALIASLCVPSGPEEETPSASLALKSRLVSQHHGRWTVRYEVEYLGAEPLDVSPSEVGVTYTGWVANSRIRAHAVPRKSEVQFLLAEAMPAISTVIGSANEKIRCRERISLAVVVNPAPASEIILAKHEPMPMRIAPRQTFGLVFTIEHEHFLHGTYDPLLGERKLEIQFGPHRLLDTLSLDEELAPATPTVKLSQPPKDRMDDRQCRSAPDSLLLAADVPGYQYFRFDDLPVRYGTRFRLSFWYLIAVGSEGSCHVRMMEYQDTPNAWYRLDGGFDEELSVQGCWERFEHVFQTRDDTTTMAIDFRITGANVGEVWIDDVELVPLYERPPDRRVNVVRRVTGDAVKR